MKTTDEQFEFNKLNFLCFFQNQIIHERRNREKKNIQYTNYFNSAFNSLIDKNFNDAKIACKALKKRSLKWLLYSEYGFYCKVFHKKLPEIEKISLVFGFSPKHYDKFLKEIKEKLPKNRFAEQSYNIFQTFKNQEESYKTFPIKNIAVCATMSAGKSTFVNALLGRDVLPARSEATTAKITSVYDKDTSKYLLGFVEENNKLEHHCIDTNLSIINSWNDNSDVNRIYLQGDLDGIGNNGIIAAVHDTPGTNYSGNKSHHDITLSFLASNKFDALIYVANATQLCTTDESYMLKEIYKKIIKKSSIPLIFILNKADCLDSEKEDISDIIDRYRNYLNEIGFKEIVIFPLSSKAARILKMVKNGFSENLTGKEKKELKIIQTLFPDLNSTGLPEVEKYIGKIIGGNND